MNNCTSFNESVSSTRSAGDDADNVDLIEVFMNEFVTKDVNYDKDKGKIFLSFVIGIVTLVMVVLVFLTCLIYACLRCRRRCNPYKIHCEKKYQKCCRWFFAILMLLFIALIIYLLVLYTRADLRNTAHEQKKSNKANSKQRSIESALIDEYSNLYKSIFNSVDDIVSDSVKNASSLEPDLDKECGAPSTRSNVSEIIKNMSKDIDVLCLEIIMWNDFGRLFLRNVTTFVTQTKEGVTFYKTLNLAGKNINWTPMFPLIKISETLRLVEKIIEQMDNMYTAANLLSKQMHENIKKVLQPYLGDVEHEFSGRGQTLRKLSDTLSNGDGEQFRSTNGNSVDYEPLPIWILIFEYICFVLIVLIIVILLLALIKRCCGKRWRGEQGPKRKIKCCSQERGSCLFQLAVYMMCLLFILALLPIWWNFEHGVGKYNGKCKKSSTDIYTPSITKSWTVRHRRSRVERDNEDGNENLNENNFSNDTTNGESNSIQAVNETTSDDVDEANNECHTREVELFLASNVTDINNKLAPPNVSELAKTASNISSPAPAMKKLKQSARYADENHMKKLCDNFKTQLDKSDLINLYEKVNSFVSKQMVDTGKNEKNLSLCNLYALKEYIIDDYDNHIVPNLVMSINEQCNAIDAFFNEGFRMYTTRCLNEVQKIEKSYKENIYHVLDDTTKNLHQHFKDELENYQTFVVNELGKAERGAGGPDDCMAYTNSKNSVWIPLLLILLLFLPLIPIAIYLSRLYTCMPIRTLQQPCSCVEARLYNAIKYRLYKRGDDIQRQANKLLKAPCTCQNRNDIKTRPQCRCNVPVCEAQQISQAQTISEVQPSAEVVLAGVSPAVIATAEPETSKPIVGAVSSAQPCRRMKFKVKLKFITTQRS